MAVLTRKLFRTIKTTRGQFIALAVIIMVGVIVYISMATAFYNLSRSRDAFYQESDFADYFFHVVKAPETVLQRIENIPGVIKATGRIQKDIPIIRPNNERAVGRLTSYPLPVDRELNRLYLLSGQSFAKESSGNIEILLDTGYVTANSLKQGDKIEIIAEGRKIPLLLTGTATSPEFIYPMKDAGSLFPEPGTFGIIMISHEDAQQILNMQGQLNQVVIKLTPGADEKKIEEQIKDILKPYGNIASYPQKEQLSNATLKAEIDGLRTTSRYLPLFFFIVAAGIQFVLLRRLIKSQRTEIGVLKALGYKDIRIIAHFTGYTLMVTMIGALAGIVIGIIMASAISEMYAMFFNLPQTIGGINLRAVAYSVLLSTALGLSAGVLASMSVLKIAPAEAMRPETPLSGVRIIIEKWKAFWSRLNSSWRMVFRSIARNRGRFIVTTLGIGSAVALLVLALFTNDAVDYMINQQYEQVNRYDYMIRMDSPVKAAELLPWHRWEEVQKLEPLLELPVEIKFSGKSEDELLIGLEMRAKLKRIIDKEGKIVQVPEEGILLSERSAGKLGVKLGDRLEVETKLIQGPAQTSSLRVVGLHNQLLGDASYVSLRTAERLIKEGKVINAVMLKLDNGTGNNKIEKRLNDMTNVNSILSLQKEKDNFLKLLDSMIYFITVMVLFAAILGMAIVYNSSAMNFNERKREMASLRLMGFSVREVKAILRKESWIQAAVGIIIGLAAGRILGGLYISSVNTDFFTFPMIIYPRSYVLAAAGAAVFVIIGQYFVLRRVKKLDIVETLKNRE